MPGLRQQIPRIMKVYLYSSARSSVKFPDALIIHKRIHLEDHVPISVLFVQVDFTPDAFQDLVPEGLGSHKKLDIVIFSRIACKGIKKVRDIFAYK